MSTRPGASARRHCASAAAVDSPLAGIWPGTFAPVRLEVAVKTLRCGQAAAVRRVDVKPQDYSARTAYRPPAGWYRRLNWLGVLLTSLGLAPRDAVTLQVRGRTTGKARRVPILRTRYRGDDYLVALAGESQWVRNVRAARGHAVIRRRGARQVYLEELASTERAEIIAEYLQAGQRRSGAEANADQARFYFGLDPEPSIGDIEAIADNYPVFRITYEVEDTQVRPEDD